MGAAVAARGAAMAVMAVMAAMAAMDGAAMDGAAMAAMDGAAMAAMDGAVMAAMDIKGIMDIMLHSTNGQDITMSSTQDQESFPIMMAIMRIPTTGRNDFQSRLCSDFP